MAEGFSNEEKGVLMSLIDKLVLLTVRQEKELIELKEYITVNTALASQLVQDVEALKLRCSMQERELDALRDGRE